MLARTVFLQAAAATLLLGALPFVAGHGSDDMHMEATAASVGVDSPAAFESYFRHPHYFAWNLAHTILMILAWFVLMPLALMLSVARSRYHLPAQILFHISQGLGLFAGFVYNHSTPDLYVNNAHHPVGWVVAAFTIVWTLMSFYIAYGEYKSSRKAASNHKQSMSAQDMARYNHLHSYNDEDSPRDSRDSRDSGQGTERNSVSLFGSRENSVDSIHQKQEASEEDDYSREEGPKERDYERQGFLGENRVDRFVSRSVRKLSTHRASRIVRGCQIVLEKLLLILGFTALTTGFIVSGGLFRERTIFSGLAHYIKGGIFVFYGLLTLGRWMGAFAEFGWAWNIRPGYPLVAKWKSRIPSAEFTESFVIWLYGASNVFLEHMNNWGKGWSPSDLEHLSITVLFFGGGLLGMLIESKSARELFDTSVVVQKSKEDQDDDAPAPTSRFPANGAPADHLQRWEQQPQRISLNPMPALTIMLLGMMMGAHHQQSMVSTMLHAQWGGLFTAFALARAVTYISLYLKPPTSHFPSRPPSEIVAAFCLTSGGLLFMNSAADVVWAIESNGLDAMTIFTVTMGLTGITLAWELFTFAVKGWAVRKERAAAGIPLSATM